MYDNDSPIIYEVSLTDGSLKSSVMQASTSFGNIERPIMVQFGDDDTQLIISYPYDSGTNMIIWSTSSSSVVSSYSSISGVQITALSEWLNKGMLSFASGSAAALKIQRFYYYDLAQRTLVLSGSVTLSAISSYTYSSNSSVSISSETPLTSTDYNPTITTIATNQSSNSAVSIAYTRGDIIYTNGNNQFHSVQSGFSGNLTFDYFCHKSANFSSVTLYEITSGVSSWISIDSGYTHLTVNAPTVTTVTNYTFGISYVNGANNITSESTLAVYLCGVSNCGTCSYSTRDTQCTTCNSGYTLSSDGSTCNEPIAKEDEAVEAMAITTQAVVGATIALSIIFQATTNPKGSSGRSTWTMINQYQLILLLPMLGTYLDDDLRFYITEFELVSFDFDFMDFIKFPFIDSQVDGIDYEQSETLFAKNGIESGSFFYNHYRFVKIIIIMFIANLIFILAKTLIIKLKPRHK